MQLLKYNEIFEKAINRFMAFSKVSLYFNNCIDLDLPSNFLIIIKKIEGMGRSFNS